MADCNKSGQKIRAFCSERNLTESQFHLGRRTLAVKPMVRLQLFALAYNLANCLRRLALPLGIRHWSLMTQKEKLIKVGAKVIWHAGYLTFQMAEVAIRRNIFQSILRRIAKFRLPTPRAAPT
jgi:Transposase DDE domain group 1